MPNLWQGKRVSSFACFLIVIWQKLSGSGHHLGLGYRTVSQKSSYEWIKEWFFLPQHLQLFLAMGHHSLVYLENYKQRNL